MEKLIEFVVNHPYLVTAFIALLAALIYTEGRKAGATITTSQLTSAVNNKDAIVVDVRDGKEFQEGHIVNAINIPSAKFAERMKELDKHKDKPIVIVDKMGQQGSTAGKALKAAGFEQVMRLQGGMQTWTSENLPVIK
ncbi:rhodanese-like domain-containing protein [Spartinivicinus ruber]|uniref:rhodanese-like domain-containing protein n=1 Tax=Spartinivicinus ruber TaxID=2683272 RepID=UPI0013D856E4|nr:rhodanese-like domain-containing protein [Spartinivicinus ruber]